MPRSTDASALGLRARRKQSTRAALIDTALRLFAERGYGEVTVEDICSVVEVSPRTFFRYFPTKEDVLAAPITALLELIVATLAAQPADADPWPALRAALGAAAGHVDDWSTAFGRVGAVVRETPSALASSARAMMESEQAVRAEVARRLGPEPDDVTVRLLVGLANVALRTALDIWSEAGAAGSPAALMTRALDALEPGARAVLSAGRPDPA